MSSAFARGNNYFVILAGGTGTRLWPLSTKQLPKQLLCLADGVSLLEQTIQMVRAYQENPAQIWISTSQAYAPLIEKAYGSLVDNIVSEPAARNTGPAILLSCLQIYATDPDAIVFFLPADSYIPVHDLPLFTLAAGKAFACARARKAIALFGIKPTYAATGYGYIEYAIEKTGKGTELYQVKKFYEKPTLSVAHAYSKSEAMLWNIGIFCAKVSIFLQEFELHAPELHCLVHDSMHGNALFEHVPSISVDHALIELSEITWVLPVDFSWNDIGTLAVFLSLKQSMQGLTAKVVSHNAMDNLVDVPDKLVGLIGVDNLCVIETKDTLLIMHRDQAEHVREIVQQLKELEWFKYL